jgi:hydroxymethylbilane synthase
VRIADIRGNVDTRVKKALDSLGMYDAIMLAQSGLERLGYSGVISQNLPLDVMLPAPGQGALAVQCRADAASRRLLAPLDHLPTRCAVLAERAFLAALGGGCSMPVAAHGSVRGSELYLQGRIVALDGSHQVDVAFATSLPEGCELNAAEALGQHLAEMALQHGATGILPLLEV